MSNQSLVFSLSATVVANATFSPIASFALDAGDWEVKPIKGEFTAWSAWKKTQGCESPTKCEKGWLTSYHIWSPDFVDKPNSMISVQSKRCDTEASALKESKVTRFRLRNQSVVSFLILDSYNDNRGGLTLSLSKMVAPEKDMSSVAS